MIFYLIWQNKNCFFSETKELSCCVFFQKKYVVHILSWMLAYFQGANLTLRQRILLCHVCHF